MIKIIRIFMIGYSTDKGGVEAYIENLCSNLDDKKFEIVYCWPKMTINGKDWIPPASRHDYFKYRAFWKSFFKENKFDVVYFNTCDIVSIDMLKFAKDAGVPVRIIHSHNTANQQSIGGRLSFVHKFMEAQNRKNIEKYATDLLACSESAGDWMFENHKYILIKNGINLKKYSYNENIRKQIREKFNICDSKLIGVVGRFDPQKNPIYTVNIMSEVSKLDDDAKLVMIGDGELRNEVEAEIESLGLKDKIILTGAINNVYEWMSAIDCLMMPSLFEGLPFVLVEAQAAGIHSLVSSTVSEESNLTGLVEFEKLESDKKQWAERALALCEKEREDVSDTLVKKGYSIENTANVVSNIIFERLK